MPNGYTSEDMKMVNETKKSWVITAFG